MKSEKAKISELENTIKSLRVENNELKKLLSGKDDNRKVKAPKPFDTIFKKAEETVGEYFKSLRFKPSEGTIEIKDERYVLVRASALSYDFFNSFLQIYRDRGEDEAMHIAKNILFDMAHLIGLEDARNFHKKMKLKDPISKLSAGPVHFAYSGWAFVDILPESRPSPDENYYLKYHHPFSFEADSWLRAGKKSKVPVCIMNSGYSSGWCEESFGIPLTAVEITCRAKGDKHCTFIMAPPHKIGKYVKSEKKQLKDKGINIPSFLERKKIEEDLKLSERHYRDIFEGASDLIQSIDIKGNILFVNESWRSTLGYSAQELEGRNIIDFIHPDYRDHCGMTMQAMAEGLVEGIEKMEIMFLTKSGKKILVEGNVSIRKEKGQPVGTRGIFRNITEKKQEAEKIKQSLKEKEVLLKEIHHRVKNNLQIISSLLNLQADFIKDKPAREKYNESIGRVKSMAIIHELLYRSKSLSSIKLGDYVRELVSYISKTYNIAKGVKVEMNINVSNDLIEMDKAIPCGIIINELLSNAFKYAFAKRSSGTIKVEFNELKNQKFKYELFVSDNGVGLPKKFDFINPSTLGLQLVQTLTQQIGGKLEVSSKKGTTFKIRFS
jgi:PAS domain S-box-containing protein